MIKGRERERESTERDVDEKCLGIGQAAVAVNGVAEATVAARGSAAAPFNGAPTHFLPLLRGLKT